MQQPTVGRIVYFCDRDEFVSASEQNRPVEPWAAIITRVHRDKDGQPTGVVNLVVYDPELGARVKLDARPSEDGTFKSVGPGSWCWPALVEPTPTKKAKK